jgi:hypothetical protein
MSHIMEGHCPYSSILLVHDSLERYHWERDRTNLTFIPGVNPFKPQAVEAQEKGWEGRRFPTKFHFRRLKAGKGLAREADINSRMRISAAALLASVISL